MFGILFRFHNKAQERRFALCNQKYTFMHIFFCAVCELTSNDNSSNKVKDTYAILARYNTQHQIWIRITEFLMVLILEQIKMIFE